MATAIRSLSYPQILDKLQSILVTGILNASPANAALWIQLTAGIDSRLLLAATALTRIPTKTVTLDYRWIERGDLELPPQLAAAVGLPHTLINRGSFSKHLAGQYDDHTGGHHPEADREFYARNQMNWAQEKDVVLRGGCFHVARSFYWHLFGQHDRPDPNLFANAFVEDPRSSGVTGLCEWFEWAAQNPQAGLDWRDRLYWEQRLAGWLSSNEQALDLCKFESHNPINSAEALGLLLSVPLEIRRRGQHHKDLIERMAPELLKFPFNPPDSRLRRCVGWAVGIAPRLVDPRYSLRLIKRKISK